MKVSWCSLTVLLLCASAAQARDASDTACFPQCRSGYTCYNGECVSLCNPPCLSYETCTVEGECVETEETRLRDPAYTPKSETSGLAIGAGLGYQYALLGGQLLYYIQIPETLFRVTPYAGGGYWPSTGDHDGKPGYSLGVMASFGGNHRVVLDLNYGLAAMEGYSSDGIEFVTHTLYGITLALGYEYMSGGGFFVRPQFGGTYLTDAWTVVDESRLDVTLNIGLGFKIW